MLQTEDARRAGGSVSQAHLSFLCGPRGSLKPSIVGCQATVLLLSEKIITVVLCKKRNAENSSNEELTKWEEDVEVE